MKNIFLFAGILLLLYILGLSRLLLAKIKTFEELIKDKKNIYALLLGLFFLFVHYHFFYHPY